MTKQTNNSNTQNKPQTEPNNSQTEPNSSQTEPSNSQTEPNNSQNQGNGATIKLQAQPSAAAGTAEDTLGAYKDMFGQMKAQNDALIEQNKSLQNQIGILIRNGSSVGHNSGSASSGALDNPGSGSATGDPQGDHYVSLADLGSQIGKRDYRSHNSIRGDD